MDTAHWPQEIVIKPIEEIVTNTCPKPVGGKISRATTTKEQQVLNCPRCNSTNTKFCYYNNYSLTQPRYFCKTCRRYWTEGGSLRNIPVGGGSRKNKRSSSSSLNNINSSSSNSSIISSISCVNSNSKKLPDLITPPSNSSNSNSTHHHPHHQFQNPNQDLNLAFPSNGGAIRSFSELIQLPINNNNSSGSSVVVADSQLQSQQMSALELLTGFSSRGLNSFLPSMQIHHHQDPNSLGFQDFKLPSLNFSLDHGNIGSGGGYGNSTMQENTSGRLLFPFEDLKQQVSSNNINNGENEIDDHDQQDREQGDHHSAGYWSGMLGGGANGSW